MSFQDSGGDGPPVLFSHVGGETFDDQVAELRDVYRVLTYDGGDEAAPARAIFELLDRLGIERAVLAGCAAGAEVSVRAALLHPDRVRALVLIDPHLMPVDALAHRLEELAMPLLLLHGADEDAAANPTATLICAAASDCRGIVAVPGAGRAPHRSDPDAVSTALRSFLEGLPA